MARVDNWDFFNSNVQSGLLEGRYMNAAFTLVAAGPPRLAATVAGGVSALQGVEGEDLPGDLAYPIGVLQSINLGINSQWLRLFEIGSERSYFVRGRTQGQVGLGRIMYHGPSLLRVLYAYLDGLAPGAQFESLYPNAQKAKLNTNTLLKESYALPPGYENMWMDLASDVFSQPMGLMIYFRDSNEDTVGAFYLEYANVANYGFSTDAGGTILSEQASILYERIVPIDIQAVSLIKDASSIESILGAPVIGSAAGPPSATA
jgi:hypothetical protein